MKKFILANLFIFVASCSSHLQGDLAKNEIQTQYLVYKTAENSDSFVSSQDIINELFQ